MPRGVRRYRTTETCKSCRSWFVYKFTKTKQTQIIQSTKAGASASLRPQANNNLTQPYISLSSQHSMSEPGAGCRNIQGYIDRVKRRMSGSRATRHTYNYARSDHHYTNSTGVVITGNCTFMGALTRRSAQSHLRRKAHNPQYLHFLYTVGLLKYFARGGDLSHG